MLYFPPLICQTYGWPQPNIYLSPAISEMSLKEAKHTQRWFKILLRTIHNDSLFNYNVNPAHLRLYKDKMYVM